MTGTLAQIISIVCFGNVVLSGQAVDITNGHSTMQFCNKVAFVQVGPSGNKSKEVVIANSFSEWLNYLRRRGVSRLNLIYTNSNHKDLTDRMTAGFVGGGGRWLIEAVHGEKADIWEAKWEVTDKDNKDKRIWFVAYGEIAQDYSLFKVLSIPLSEAHADLKNALTAILAFAKKHDAGKHWIDSFGLALDCLNSKDPLTKVYHKDLIPNGSLNLTAQQLLAAAQAGYVFGGMGSWNDMGFEGGIQKEYEKVSDDLFLVVNSAIVSAVNSYPSY